MQELLSKPIVEQLYFQARQRAARLIDHGIDPQLAVVWVGENPQSAQYVSLKSRRATETGVILSVYHMPESTPFNEVYQTVHFLVNDPDVHGIIIQLPLPNSFSEEEVANLIGHIPLHKDVDGLNASWATIPPDRLPQTLDQLTTSKVLLHPIVCSVISLLDYYKIPFLDQKIVIVGEGVLVGAPLRTYFTILQTDVQSVNEQTEDILTITKQADLLITGTGEPQLITYQWVKPGAVVIDCAMDVHVDSVSQIAAALAPPKGGIGPLTVAWLLHNTILATERSTDA